MNKGSGNCSIHLQSQDFDNLKHMMEVAAALWISSLK